MTDRKGRGRPPRGPTPPASSASPSPEKLSAFAKRELPDKERLRIADYLMFEATADEIESFEVITRTSPFGAEVFDRLWTRITDAASSVFNFVMTEDHHAPGLLSFDADEELGEAVVADIRNENLNDWLIVFARFDYGPLVCVVPWQRPQDGAPFFFPPHYATDVQVVSAVISARQKPLTKTPPLALQELNDLPEGRVRWAASRFDLTS